MVHLHQSNNMLILWANQSLDIFNLLFDHNFEGHCLASYKRWIKSFNVWMFLMLCFDNKWRRVTVLFWVGGQGRTSPIHAPNLPSQPFHKYIIMRLCTIFDSSVIGQPTKCQTNRPTPRQDYFLPSCPSLTEGEYMEWLDDRSEYCCLLIMPLSQFVKVNLL